jgi:hypothetical protein
MVRINTLSVNALNHKNRFIVSPLMEYFVFAFVLLRDPPVPGVEKWPDTNSELFSTVMGNRER